MTGSAFVCDFDPREPTPFDEGMGLAVAEMGCETEEPLWTPDSAPQSAAIASDADVLFYGGSAGGGKSDLLLGLSATQHRKSIIFRREYPQLKDLISRSKEIGEDGAYNGQAHVMTFENGRSVEFGAAQYEDDVKKFKGRPHDLKAFDEVSDFTEDQFRFISAWTRSAIPGQRCRIVCAGNPPTTAEGQWVISYFGPWLDPDHANPAAPGELRWFARLNDEDVEVDGPEHFKHNDEMIEPHSRTFIPASLKDNKYLTNTKYRSTLMALPEPYRSQLLYGNFGATPADHEWQCIPTAWIKAAQARWTGEPTGPMTALGVDCARGGRDNMSMAPLHGNHFASMVNIPGPDVTTGQLAAKHIHQTWRDGAVVNIDVIGIGSSVYDSMQGEDIHNPRICAINTGEGAPETSSGQKSTDKSEMLTFKNLRAFAWWKFREALDPMTGRNIALPPDSRLAADLAAPRYWIAGGVIHIEPKYPTATHNTAIVKRLGRSTDDGDAVMNASLIWYQPDIEMDYETVESTRYSRSRGWG